MIYRRKQMVSSYDSPPPNSSSDLREGPPSKSSSRTREKHTFVGSRARNWSEPWTRSRNIALSSWQHGISISLPRCRTAGSAFGLAGNTPLYHRFIGLCLPLDQGKEATSKNSSQHLLTPTWLLQHPQPSSSAHCASQMGRSSLTTELSWRR